LTHNRHFHILGAPNSELLSNHMISANFLNRNATKGVDMKAEDLVGTYIGCGQEHVAKDGTVTRPLGRKCPYLSWIVYTKEGHVIVVSTPTDRKSISGKRIEDASRDELAKMAEGVVAYAGRYEMKDGKVHHNIQVSFFPNWVGRANIRTPSFEGNLLTLTTEPEEDGSFQRIFWERVTSA